MDQEVSPKVFENDYRKGRRKTEYIRNKQKKYSTLELFCVKSI